MRTIIKHSLIKEEIDIDNRDRELDNLPPVSNFIPQEDIVDIANDTIMDYSGRNGINTATLMETFEPEGCSWESAETVDSMVVMQKYIGHISPHFTIKRMRLLPEGLEVKLGVEDN